MSEVADAIRTGLLMSEIMTAARTEADQVLTVSAAEPSLCGHTGSTMICRFGKTIIGMKSHGDQLEITLQLPAPVDETEAVAVMLGLAEEAMGDPAYVVGYVEPSGRDSDAVMPDTLPDDWTV